MTSRRLTPALLGPALVATEEEQLSPAATDDPVWRAMERSVEQTPHMPLAPLDRSRLVLAYGRHWRREEVLWSKGDGWQMLGRIGDRRPKLLMCDFSYARGVYVLELRRKPVYVRIARGAEGLRTRLARHHTENTKRWTSFSWFSFDGVTDTGTRAEPLPSQWAKIKDRDFVARGDTEARIKEMEAIFVGLLGPGLTNVQKPRFGTAREWEQVVSSNFGRSGICSRVERSGFRPDELSRFRD